jgi:hypothetical protein
MLETTAVGLTVPPDAAQATWRALLPLVHSTLVPGWMRTLQQGQTEANLAVMVIGSCPFLPVVPAFAAARFVRLTHLSIRPSVPIDKGVRSFFVSIFWGPTIPRA